MKRSGEHCERPVSSAEHFSNLAKYSKYPVIVSGRPATVVRNAYTMGIYTSNLGFILILSDA